MKTAKATFVTIIMAVMLLLIVLGLYILWKPGFTIITGAFAAYGYANGFCNFLRWLEKEPRHIENPEPPDVFHADPVDWSEDIPGGAEGFEAIIEEVKAADV